MASQPTDDGNWKETVEPSFHPIARRVVIRMDCNPWVAP
jgi:hypothetical protein